ncbi:hypothetical protein CDL12_26366 [Handroanthus impetiginosus]|uniref:Gnk2-homologous domain-containing protein n=1 Tax=Handroanthus impetiginosus TaxID=429701 RepID=A0A2G9G7E8_9LAMI|nr:hypothetical protein CDL12_26366 [Handroanthus impetiginosus]
MHRMYNFLLLFFLSRFIAESADPLGNFCNDDTKTNGSSQTSRNIDLLLPKLVSGTVENGFIATSYGEGDARIYGLAQCRGDVSEDDCSGCIQVAAKHLHPLCPDQTDAKIFYDNCFLRYKTVKFFGEVDVSGIHYYNIENVTDPDVFNQKLGALMDQISSEAVKPSQKGLGKGKSKISSFVTLYALVQCTRDLSDINCAQCLAIGIGNFPTYCNNRKGCRVLYSSCYVRYELYPFYFPLDPENESLAGGFVKNKSISAYKP